MKVKARISFSGLVSMSVGDVFDISDDVAKDLLDAEYVEAVEATAEEAPKNEGKRVKSKRNS